MVPSGERTSLEVIETKLPFQLFIDALRVPTLPGDAHDLLLAEPTRQRREDELRRLILAFGPFHHEPYGLVRRRLEPVVAGDLDPPEAEPRRQLTAGSFTPRHPSKGAWSQGNTKVPGADGFAPASLALVETPHLGRRVHPHRVIEAVQTHRLAKQARLAIGAVGQNDLARKAVLCGSFNHAKRLLDLRLESQLFRDPGGGAPRGILGPGRRQVEREVDGQVLGAGRDTEAHADLTIGNLARRARVLALHADRTGPLLEEACVVDDPGRHLLSPRAQRRESVPCDHPPHGVVVPARPREEVEELVVRVLRFRLVAARARRDRLDALALPLAEDAEGVHGEGFPLALVPQTPSNSSKYASMRATPATSHWQLMPPDRTTTEVGPNFPQ